MAFQNSYYNYNYITLKLCSYSCIEQNEMLKLFKSLFLMMYLSHLHTKNIACKMGFI